MNSTMNKERLTKVYETMLPVIRGAARKRCRKYGGDFGEVFAEANLHFVECMADYDWERGDPRARVWNKVYLSLVETVRREARKKHGKTTIPLSQLRPGDGVHFHNTDAYGRYEVEGGSILEDRSHHFDPDLFSSELSEDAKLAMKLALEPPTGCVRADKNKPEVLRDKISWFLADLGWSVRRITESFHEIAEALGG